MTKQMNKMLIYAGIFFAIVFTIYGVKKVVFMWFMSHYKPPAVTISAATVNNQTWQSYATSVGTLNAINGVELSAEVPGVIQNINFNSGQMIKKGDVLIVMRTQLEEANLKSSQAKLQLAKMNYERENILSAKKVTSQASLDTRRAEFLQAQANVESAQAQIQQKTITAPFDGKLGIKQVNLGQYVSPGTPLVTLQSLNPLYVMFNLPEQYLPALYIGQDIDITANVGKGKTIRGKITAINAKVESNTRNILVQATIPNENFILYPGMYGLVKIWFKDKNTHVIIPQTAVSYSMSGDYVFIIKDEDKTKKSPLLRAYRQYVKVGERRGNEVAVIEGLKSGDQVVTAGQLKLQNGTTVLIDNSVAL